MSEGRRVPNETAVAQDAPVVFRPHPEAGRRGTIDPGRARWAARPPIVGGALPPPPPDAELRRMARAARAAETTPPHFFAGPGPLDVRPVDGRTRVERRDGSRYRPTHRIDWCLDRVAGVDRRTALRRLYDALLDPRGWTRTGVHWRRVRTAAEADLLVRVVPAAETACGRGAIGCYSWGGAGPALAEVGVEYIDRDEVWQVLVGMEICGHGTFRMTDAYTGPHRPYPCGQMGDWEAAACSGFRPSDAEIAAAALWLRGGTPGALIHDD